MVEPRPRSATNRPGQRKRPPQQLRGAGHAPFPDRRAHHGTGNDFAVHRDRLHDFDCKAELLAQFLQPLVIAGLLVPEAEAVSHQHDARAQRPGKRRANELLGGKRCQLGGKIQHQRGIQTQPSEPGYLLLQCLQQWRRLLGPQAPSADADRT